MGRQVTLDEVFGELIDACGRDAGMQAFKIISQHLENGDRIKIDQQPAAEATEATEVPPLPIGVTPYYGYEVGDPDPTPNDPPFCGARYGHPTGGPWCAWRPKHDGPHVSGDGQQILAVFPWKTEAGFHQDAGKTPEELRSEAPPDTPSVVPDPSPRSGTVLWRMSEALRERVDTAHSISEQELAEQVRMAVQLLVAVAERVEQ